MERAWELFHKLNRKNNKHMDAISPAAWMENPELLARRWEAYKRNVPRIFAEFVFLNPDSYYMEYCYRIVRGIDKPLRVPFVPEGQNNII